jgi:putative colanic acid biosynthesis acetyltransferase WcaF
MHKTTQLNNFNNSWYNSGAGNIKKLAWYLTNALFFNSSFPFIGIKHFILRFYGAKVGKGLIIKNHVNIKYPWYLNIGDHCWIGEKVWIDNLAPVLIADNVCISQGAMLLTGNHNYKKETFDLMVGEIKIEKGVWIGAKSIICPGLTLKSHSVISVGSVLTQNTEPYYIYQGNPAQKIKQRIIA